GAVVVLVLAALILTFDFQFLRCAFFVPDAHGAFGLVDVLSTRAAGAHLLPLDVLVLDVDLDLVRLGQDSNGGGGGVDTALLLRLGHALHAMAAGLVAEVLINAVALDAKRHFLEAALLAGTEADFLDLPAAVAGEVLVHVVEIAGEERRFVAAGAGTNF